jgi:hypothetical protein
MAASHWRAARTMVVEAAVVTRPLCGLAIAQCVARSLCRDCQPRYNFTGDFCHPLCALSPVILLLFNDLLTNRTIICNKPVRRNDESGWHRKAHRWENNSTRRLLLPVLTGGHRPADNQLALQVNHRAQVQPALGGADVGDVGGPLGIRRQRHEVALEMIASMDRPLRQ